MIQYTEIEIPSGVKLLGMILKSREAQHYGFQHHATCPRNIALKFPGCGTEPFHMENVAFPLILVGTDSEGRVVALERREPGTPAKSLDNSREHGRARDIYEMHPDYAETFAIGESRIVELGLPGTIVSDLARLIE